MLIPSCIIGSFFLSRCLCSFIWMIFIVFAFFFMRWEYIDKITPLPFILQNHIIYPSLLSFKFMNSFLLIGITWLFLYVYTHIFLNTTFLVCIILLIYMLSGMTFSIVYIGVLFFGEDYFFCCHHSLVFYRSLCRVEA